MQRRHTEVLFSVICMTGLLTPALADEGQPMHIPAGEASRLSPDSAPDVRVNESVVLGRFGYALASAVLFNAIFDECIEVN
jgi:hypothetical protein